MKRFLLLLGVVGIISATNATMIHAEYIVAPAPEEADGTSAGYAWYCAEQQRWIDRLISNNAESVKQIENPIDRLAAVVKAVADYSEVCESPDYELEVKFATGCLGEETMSKYTEILGKAVGLDITQFSGFKGDGSTLFLNTCHIDGVVYWADSFAYDRFNEPYLLGTATQPDYVYDLKKYQTKVMETPD